MDYKQPKGAVANASYVDGNPGAGVEGSIVPAAAIESPMREIVAAITAAGIVPSGADLTQLGQAITALANSAIATGFAQKSLAANGYQKLPGGMILQWGSFTTGASGAVTVTLPIAFPNAAVCFNGCVQDPGNSIADVVTFQNLTTTSVLAIVTNGGGNGLNGAIGRYFVIGY